MGRRDLLPTAKNNWSYALNVNPHLIWYTFRKPGMSRSYKRNSSQQLLSSVPFSDLKLNLGLIQLGDLSSGHYLSNILTWAQSVSIYNTHTFPSDFNFSLSLS